MKNFSILLLLFISTPSFSDTFEEGVTSKASAVFGLMKCLPDQAKYAIGTCYEEIQGAMDNDISEAFIVELMSKRNLDLLDSINQKSTSWYWAKAYAAIEEM